MPLSAARTALIYEDRIYRHDLGTWPDLRLKQTDAMHGLCSGAPGIGISMMRIERALASIPMTFLKDQEELFTEIHVLAERNLKRAYDAVSTRSFLYRDHLCCGNASVVWFLLESAAYYEKMLDQNAGQKKKQEQLLYAGSILAGMKKRKDEAGGYTLTVPGYRAMEDHTLFYGTYGVGIVMLRYAAGW